MKELRDNTNKKASGDEMDGSDLQYSQSENQLDLKNLLSQIKHYKDELEMKNSISFDLNS